MTQIAQTPAEGVAGLAVKTRIVLRGIEDGLADVEKDVAASLARDAHALAGMPMTARPAPAEDPTQTEEWTRPAWMVEAGAEAERLRELELPRPHGFTAGDVALMGWLLRRISAEMGQAAARRVLVLSEMDASRFGPDFTTTWDRPA